MEQYQPAPSCSSSSHVCENCEEQVPTHSCIDCHLQLCAECGSIHPKIKQTKNHTVVPLPKGNSIHDDNVDDCDEDIVELDASDDIDSKSKRSSSCCDGNSHHNASSHMEEVDDFLDNSIYHKICTAMLKYLPGGDKKGQLFFSRLYSLHISYHACCIHLLHQLSSKIILIVS